jgi:hypothetical protein
MGLKSWHDLSTNMAISFVQSWENRAWSCTIMGKIMARTWEDHGKSMGRTWEDHDKNMGRS